MIKNIVLLSFDLKYNLLFIVYFSIPNTYLLSFDKTHFSFILVNSDNEGLIYNLILLNGTGKIVDDKNLSKSID